MYAVMTLQKNIWESRYVFDFRLGILFSKQPIKKIRINSKILCPQSPPFSRAKPAKRNERAMGTRMACLTIFDERCPGTSKTLFWCPVPPLLDALMEWPHKYRGSYVGAIGKAAAANHVPTPFLFAQLLQFAKNTRYFREMLSLILQHVQGNLFQFNGK